MSGAPFIAPIEDIRRKRDHPTRRDLILLGAGLTGLAGNLSGAPGVVRLIPLNEAGYPKLLQSVKDSVALVDFWATWCAPCLEELPHLVQLHSKYEGKGFKLITVSCDEPETEKKAVPMLQKYGAPAPAYLKAAEDDEKFINLVDPKWSGALPGLFLYDRQGKLARSFTGETETSTVQTAVMKLL